MVDENYKREAKRKKTLKIETLRQNKEKKWNYASLIQRIEVALNGEKKKIQKQYITNKKVYENNWSRKYRQKL